MHIRKDRAAGHCDTCAEEKAKRAPVNKASGTRAKKKLDIVHTDVLGPIHQESYEGFQYAIGFIDSYSRYAVMYRMRTQDEDIEKLELFMADVGSFGTLVSNRAQDYKSRGFNEVCCKNGVRQEYSAPYTQQENVKIERVWALSQERRGACSKRLVCQTNFSLMLWLRFSMSKTDVFTLRTTVSRVKCSLVRGQT